MCEICHLVLRKLVARGLVSAGNVREQRREILEDIEKALTNLSPKDIEHLKEVEQRGYDA